MYDKPKIDLFIIDVNMTEVDSIELKNMISQMYEETNIVFVTDNDSNMRDAFGNKKCIWEQKSAFGNKIPGQM